MDQPDSAPRRSWVKALLHLVRRAHMYAGLFLLPWSVLYGVTAFLFNHPTAFSDQPAASFGRAALAGTPMESPPPPAAVAEQVVAALRARTPTAACTLVDPDLARYTREFAFAVVRADGWETNVLVDAAGAGGSVRSRDVPPPKVEEPAPFAVGGPAARPKTSGGPADAVKIADPLHERVKAAVPVVLERTGFPGGDVTVTSVPDLSFLMDADGRVRPAGRRGSPAADPIDAELPAAAAHGPRLPVPGGRPVGLGRPRGRDGRGARALGRVRTGHVVAGQGGPTARRGGAGPGRGDGGRPGRRRPNGHGRMTGVASTGRTAHNTPDGVHPA
jgi:hypothetical protein